MPKLRSDPADTDEPPGFEAALAELEAIARSLDDGTLGLDESLARFERGVGLLRHCHGMLDAAERRIALLTGFDADGQPVTEPFDATATAGQRTPGRRKPRTAAAPGPEAAPGSDDADSPAGRGLF